MQKLAIFLVAQSFFCGAVLGMRDDGSSSASQVGCSSSSVSSQKWDPDLYEAAVPSELKEAAEQLINDHFDENVRTILDIGCGGGAMTDYLAKKYSLATVIGIDASSDMIAHAQKTYDRVKLRFEQKDIFDMQEDEKFDQIYCISTLHWIHEQQKLCSKVYTLLKPQGVFLGLSLGKYKGEGEIHPLTLCFEELNNKGILLPPAAPMRASPTSMTEEALIQLLRDASLQPKKVECTQLRLKFMEPYGLPKWIASWMGSCSTTAGVPPDRVNEVAICLVQAYREKVKKDPTDPYSLPYQYPLLAFVGVKGSLVVTAGGSGREVYSSTGETAAAAAMQIADPALYVARLRNYKKENDHQPH